MKDLPRAMKLSLIYGLIGAALIPFLYEFYANISRTGALVLVGIWAIGVGLKFSSLAFKEATVGITACLAYTGILGLICYVIIHPAIVSFLEKNSAYFLLSLKEQSLYVLYVAIILACMYIVCYAKYGIVKAISQLKGNSEKTGQYINDAFNDEGEQ